MDTDNSEMVERVARAILREGGQQVAESWEAYGERLALAAIKAQSERSSMEALSGVVGAAQALIAKLDECEEPLRGIMGVYYAHGHTYNGPSYYDEREALRAALNNTGGQSDGQEPPR